jgi:fucose permease
VICIGTILSSLFSDRLTARLGVGKVTAISVAMTAAALFGFSFSRSFWMLCLWAIPYGLGAGNVDAALNNYVALHYSRRHMNWLHCMWGIGASVGPYIIGLILSGGGHWSGGYQAIGFMQILLTGVLLFSLPLWKRENEEEAVAPPVPLRQVLSIPGAKEILLAFFCYCALEQTAGLWSASYLNLYLGFSKDQSASLGSLFFLGITSGRGICGFVTSKVSNTHMIRIGLSIIALGIAILILPLGKWAGCAAFIIIGLGCAPIYPCVIHSTPENFGPEFSHSLIGIQMASAYLGTVLMPPLFGIIAEYIHIGWMGIYLFLLLTVLFLSYQRMLRLCPRNKV